MMSGRGGALRALGLAMLTAMLTVLLAPPEAAAASYCRITRLPHFPGQDGSAQMMVVVDTVQRVSDIPGRRASQWCWMGVGSNHPFSRPAEVVAKPARGEVRTHTYGVWFRSKSAGPDSFTFRVHQYNPANNAPVATIYRVGVNVVGAAF
jgi:hypothetical protein